MKEIETLRQIHAQLRKHNESIQMLLNTRNMQLDMVKEDLAQKMAELYKLNQ